MNDSPLTPVDAPLSTAAYPGRCVCPRCSTTGVGGLLSGIYCITNTLNGKRYIGQSVRLKMRMRIHLWRLRRGDHYNEHLQAAFCKDGEKSFTFQVLEHAEPNALDALETSWINSLNTMDNKHGYNLDTGGKVNRDVSEATLIKMSRASTGRRHSEAMKQHMREIMTGRVMTREWIAKMSASKKGWNPSKETRKKMSLSRIGKTLSVEHKLNISRAVKGLKRPEWVGKKISAAKLGRKNKPFSDETKQRLRLLRNSRPKSKLPPLSEERKRQIGLNRLGNKASEETKRRMSESQKARWARAREQASCALTKPEPA